MSFEKDAILIFTGTAHRPLAEKICKYLEIPLGSATVGRFPDGEIDVKVTNDIRGADVFILQSTCPPVNDSLMELLILADCLRRASAGRITAVIPYFGYARKDRKDEGRVPITAKLVANMITVAGVDRVVSMDLHAAQIQGFFDIPVDHLYGSPILCDHYKKKNLENLVVAAPDVGGIKRARAYARILGGDLAIIDKERLSGASVRSKAIIGNVKDRDVLLTDDIIATGGTVAEAVNLLKESGARDVYVGATHAICAGSCAEKFRSVEIKEVAFTDTLPMPKNLEGITTAYLSTAELLGETIRRIHNNESVSSLFSY